MRCPACGHRFQQFASWCLAFRKPLICPDCGVECRRAGRWMPVVIAVGLLIAFNQLIGIYAFTTFGMLLLLAALVLFALWLDERTITLVVATPSEEPRK